MYIHTLAKLGALSTCFRTRNNMEIRSYVRTTAVKPLCFGDIRGMRNGELTMFWKQMIQCNLPINAEQKLHLLKTYRLPSLRQMTVYLECSSPGGKIENNVQ